MKKAVVFESRREGYGIGQIGNPLTVGELIGMLEELDEDMLVIVGHDNEYTYGTLSRTASIRREVEGEYGTEYNESYEICAW